MPRDQLLQACYLIGECIARGERQRLSDSYSHARDIRASLSKRSVLRQPLDIAINVLEGFFAAREPIERLERLAKEVNETFFWKAILGVICAEDAQQLDLAAMVDALQPNATLQKVTIELSELLTRGIVEYWPSEKASNPIYGLTPLGRDLCAKCQI